MGRHLLFFLRFAGGGPEQEEGKYQYSSNSSAALCTTTTAVVAEARLQHAHRTHPAACACAPPVLPTPGVLSTPPCMSLTQRVPRSMLACHTTDRRLAEQTGENGRLSPKQVSPRRLLWTTWNRTVGRSVWCMLVGPVSSPPLQSLSHTQQSSALNNTQTVRPERTTKSDRTQQTRSFFSKSYGVTSYYYQT